jgi:hypothetical protein
MNDFKKDSEFEGKLLYSIKIPQVGVVAHEILDRTDMTDWAILYYIYHWERIKNAKKQTVRGEEYVWINYGHLIDSLPILKIRTKDAVTKRINKLERLKLIERFLAKDNTLFLKLTELSHSVFAFHTQGEPAVQPESDSYPTTVGQPCPTRVRQPCPTEIGQHNKESLISNLDRSSNKVESEKAALDVLRKKNISPKSPKKSQDQQEPASVLNVEKYNCCLNQEKGDSPALVDSAGGNKPGGLKKVSEAVEVLERLKTPVASKAIDKLRALKKELSTDTDPLPPTPRVTYTNDFTPEHIREADSFLEEIKKKNKNRLGG